MAKRAPGPGADLPGSDVRAGSRVRRFYRHTLLIRLTHWFNFTILLILLGGDCTSFPNTKTFYDQ